MHSLLKPLLRNAILLLLSVLAIAALLMAGKVVLDAVRQPADLRAQLASLERTGREVAAYRRDAGAALAGRLRGAHRQELARIDRRIHALSQRLAPGPERALALDPRRYAADAAAAYKADIDRALWTQELAYLRQLRAYLVAAQDRARAEGELQRLGRVHRAAYAALMAKRREIARLGVIDARRIAYPLLRGPALDRLALEAAALHGANERAARAHEAQAAALRRAGVAALPPAFPLDGRASDAGADLLDARIAQARHALAEDPMARTAALLLAVLPLALQILLLCIAARYALRVVLYFVVAPLAERGAPLSIDAGACGAAAPELVAGSAVSQPVTLGAGEELLVLPRYLQSAPAGAHKSTRWLLAGRKWASLSAGAGLLTCVRTRGAEDQVVVSASGDGLCELAVLRLPAGAALVFEPRALVGIVCNRASAPDIAWHWRPFRLSAWLTLQLRYFVIRGPLTLVLQGTRGVRVGQASSGHAIGQAATLGFSAGVACSVMRSAPFLPYLRGQSDLLYDRFSGAAGVFVHDETPNGARRNGPLRRGIEGLADAVLKLAGL